MWPAFPVILGNNFIKYFAPVNLGTHFYSSVIDSFISLEIKLCKSSNFVLFQSCFDSYRTFAVLY